MSLSNIIHYMREGAERREAIVQYLKTHPEEKICVNRKWCAQLHQDRDLNYMLKKGILTRIRQASWSNRCRYTYLILVNN